MMANEYASAEITSEDKLWAMLCYVVFPPLIPILIMLFMEEKKDRPFIQYHLMNALAWGIAVLITSFLVIGICLTPFVLIISLYFGYKAFQGEYFQIPYLTEFVQKQGWIS